jgi:hypothetical protein
LAIGLTLLMAVSVHGDSAEDSAEDILELDAELDRRIRSHITGLAHKNPAFRESSYFALLRMGEPALEQVRAAQNSTDPGTRRAAINLVRTVRVPGLIRELSSPDGKTRRAAKWKLYELGSENLGQIERGTRKSGTRKSLAGPAQENVKHLLLLLRAGSEASVSPSKGACHASLKLIVDADKVFAGVDVSSQVKSDHYAVFWLEIGEEHGDGFQWKSFQSISIAGRVAGQSIGDLYSLAGRARPGDLVRVRFGFGKGNQPDSIRLGSIQAVVPGKRVPKALPQQMRQTFDWRHAFPPVPLIPPK